MRSPPLPGGAAPLLATCDLNLNLNHDPTTSALVHGNDALDRLRLGGNMYTHIGIFRGADRADT